jgi:hypothetical protein
MAEKNIGAGAITSKGLVIEETTDSFVIVPRPFKESTIKVSIDDLLEKPEEVPENIVLAKHIQFIHPVLSRWKNDSGYWLMSKTSSGKPYLLGAEVDVEVPDEEKWFSEVEFSKVISQENINFQKSSKTKKQSFENKIKFDYVEIDDEGLPNLIIDAQKEEHKHLFYFYLFYFSWSADGSYKNQKFPFSPLKFCYDLYNEESLFQDHWNSGSLIKTETISKEQFYESLIYDFYRLINTEKGVGGVVNFCGLEGVFIKQEYLIDYFSLRQ